MSLLALVLILAAALLSMVLGAGCARLLLGFLLRQALRQERRGGAQVAAPEAFAVH